MKILYLLCAAALVAVSCQFTKDATAMSDDELRAFANELAHRFIITDGHVDLPYRLKERKKLISMMKSLAMTA